MTMLPLPPLAHLDHPFEEELLAAWTLAFETNSLFLHMEETREMGQKSNGCSSDAPGVGAVCISCPPHLSAAPHIWGSESLLSHPLNDSAFYSPP